METSEALDSIEAIHIPETQIPYDTFITTESYDTNVSICTQPSPYIITIDELTNTQGAIVQKETTDRESLFNIFQPESNTLKTRLVTWASVGFPSNWVVFTAKTDPPLVCSDGQTRQYYNYILHLLGNPIQSFLDTLNSQVLGVNFNFFLCDTNTIGLNVSKV